ncbi:MAG: hypothetical protein ACFFBH_11165 [Promethearchaeota archaeon]
MNELIEEQAEDIDKEAKLFPKGLIHHLSTEMFVWNFSLVYKARTFDVIKWKTAFSWKDVAGGNGKKFQEIEKGLFIGVVAGVFFFLIDENIDRNYIQLAEMIDVFIQKTNQEAPFLVYGLLENQQGLTDLKTNSEMLKNLADIKSLVSKYGGEFKIDNLKEVKVNLPQLIREYSYYILMNLKSSSSNYSNLKFNQFYFLDYEDIAALREIELSLTDQLKIGQTVDELLSELFFKYLKKYQNNIIITSELPKPEKVQKPFTEKSEVIKIIIEEIKKGIRRQCPKCLNNDRNKIREVIDRENIIMENPNIYGFKYICGLCGYEFTKKDMIRKVEKE